MLCCVFLMWFNFCSGTVFLCFITVNYYYLLSYSSELLVLSVDQLAMSVTLQSIVLEPLERCVCVFCVYVCVCMYVHMCMHVRVSVWYCLYYLQCPADRSRQDGVDCDNGQVNNFSFSPTLILKCYINSDWFTGILLQWGMSRLGCTV